MLIPSIQLNANETTLITLVSESKLQLLFKLFIKSLNFTMDD
jgi:hypothetical protein